jgi:hypothetical protein
MYFNTVDIFDDKGHLLRLEAYDKNGEFIMQALWDPNDEQTYANRKAFREWFWKHLERSLKNEMGG